MRLIKALGDCSRLPSLVRREGNGTGLPSVDTTASPLVSNMQLHVTDSVELFLAKAEPTPNHSLHHSLIFICLLFFQSLHGLSKQWHSASLTMLRANSAGEGCWLLKLACSGDVQTASQCSCQILPTTAALRSAPLSVCLAFSSGNAHFTCLASGVIIFFFWLEIPSAIIKQITNGKSSFYRLNKSIAFLLMTIYTFLVHFTWFIKPCISVLGMDNMHNAKKSKVKLKWEAIVSPLWCYPLLT